MRKGKAKRGRQGGHAATSGAPHGACPDCGEDWKVPLLFASDLDLAVDDPECGDPECSGRPVFLKPKCHPKSAAYVSYLKGSLLFYCGECQKPLCLVSVAEAPRTAGEVH